ncbi:MAG: RNA polymerase factor sigma-54 [candidate division Zixibacteria bacterium]|nr:RNA polymerase factor sigma-54 [candidate division Zixibacteria bacterium]
MRLELGLRLKQTLAPQLIQSLKMLQMPVLKLEQVLRQELSTNPMLEEVDTLETVDESEPATVEIVEPPAESEKDEKIDWESYLGEDSEFVPHHFSEQSEEQWERAPVFELTLYDHLVEQLNFSKLTPEEIEIGEFIIGNLDPAGLLGMSVPELAEALKVPVEKVEHVLKVVQGFDPPGVGARDLQESLLIQLGQRGASESLEARIVKEHWHELDRKTHMQLAKALDVSIDRVKEAMEELRTLSPRPAQGRFTSAAMPVIPDLIVERLDEEYIVFHNDRNLPRLRVTAAYRDVLRRGSTSEEEIKKYVKDKLEQARWLINAINQRRSTMIKVMEAIVEEQKDFFDKGASFLKPLRMSDIATRVSMNVATVSRVSKEKYVQTPQGVFEIKAFFTGGVERSDGDAMTRRSVKTRIAEMIQAEDSANPLSDQDIYKKLQTDGIQLARRTVTKYREELKVPSARFRKRVFGREGAHAVHAVAKADTEPHPLPEDVEINDGFTMTREPESADDRAIGHTRLHPAAPKGASGPTVTTGRV